MSQVGDVLRVTIKCVDGDSLGLALQRVIAIFDLREGNGRLKNLLSTRKHMPPRVLINCVVTAAGCPPIMAEIQIYHAGIKKIADLQHRYYEIRRATALSELIAEADAAQSKQESDDNLTQAMPEALSGVSAASPPPQEQDTDEVPAPTSVPCTFWCDT